MVPWFDQSACSFVPTWHSSGAGRGPCQIRRSRRDRSHAQPPAAGARCCRCHRAARRATPRSCFRLGARPVAAAGYDLLDLVGPLLQHGRVRMANNDGRRVETELDRTALGCGQRRGRLSRPLDRVLIHRRVRVLHDELAEATYILAPAIAIPLDLLQRMDGVQVERALREPIGHRQRAGRSVYGTWSGQRPSAGGNAAACHGPRPQHGGKGVRPAPRLSRMRCQFGPWAGSCRLGSSGTSWSAGTFPMPRRWS
jgi:hypothetical protein